MQYIQISRKHYIHSSIYQASHPCVHCVAACVQECRHSVSWLVQVSVLFHHDILMLCMIWKTADPQTTNRKRAINAGPTGDFSSLLFNVFGIFPLAVMFLLCLSLAILILCLLAILLMG